MTKSDGIVLVRQLADDPDAKRWGASAFELLATVAMDSLWSDLLDDQEWLTSQTDEDLVPIAPGYLDLLPTADGGQLSRRLYRIQSVYVDDREYGAARPQESIVGGGIASVYEHSTYLQLGNTLYAFPLSTTPITIRYSYRPPLWSSLVAGDDIVWPDGFDMAWVARVASLMMHKGGAEDTKDMLRLADEELARLKRAIKRTYVGPITIFNPDGGPISWGSV